MDRYICIHGHFYQPPRENAWLEAIEMQDSAYPFHDWNERITSECYERNAASRILDGENRITGIINNYSRISFNFGPTLLSWLAENEPEVYDAILAADRESQQQFSGHGSAMAQAYNHMIMPLANERDRRTQVAWGMADFRHRFGREAEGMWLPETAVDVQTLEVLAEHGIRFTVLAPHQAGRIRRIGTQDWEDVGGSKVDPTRAYVANLPSGRSINIFFYDGPISRAVAFEGLLDKGEYLADRLLGAFSEDRDWPQLVHIATDGETYGHHHRFGDMALAYAVHHIESNELARITNYGEYIEKCPPTYEVEIIENTSWSCAHGIERWRSDCGCNSGGHAGWNQAWRAPLREALDWLRDSVAPEYEKTAKDLLKDPWAARQEYINVILDRSPETLDAFLERHVARPLKQDETVFILKLLELQRHAMLMYTSCGWFFDELSGIETVQVMQYAGRVVQLANELFGNDTEASFLGLIAKAKSNVRRHRDGKVIYEKLVKPAVIDLNWVAAHYAVSSLFEEYESRTGIYCYQVETEDYQVCQMGNTRLAIGRIRATSNITLESDTLSFAVLHFGDHNVNAGVGPYPGEEAYAAIVDEMTRACSDTDFPQVVRLMDKHFGTSTYSVRSLFRDEQRKVLASVLQSTLEEIESGYRQIYERHYPLLRFLADLGNPLPRVLHSVAELILNLDLRRALLSTEPDIGRIEALLEEADAWNIELDAEELSYVFKENLEELMQGSAAEPGDIERLRQVSVAAGAATALPFEVNLWKIQNLYYDLMQTALPANQQKAKEGDSAAVEWVNEFTTLGEHIWVKVT